MTDLENELKTLKIIQFSGRETDWDEWSAKFKCLAAKREYLEVLLGNTLVPSDSNTFTGLSDEQKKTMLAARKANSQGYSELLLSVKGLAFNIVNLSKTLSLKGGDLRLAWEGLQEQYDLNGIEDRMAVLEKFTQNKLYDARTDVT